MRLNMQTLTYVTFFNLHIIEKFGGVENAVYLHFYSTLKF